MKRMLLSVIAAAVLCFLVAPGWGAEGVPDQSSTYSASGPNNATAGTSFLFNGAAHVAKGTALRNRCSGSIPLRGVPVGSSLVSALLYWNFMDALSVGSTTSTELFNGNLVVGTKTADHPDLCWGTSGDHTYRAIVSPFVPSSKPNEDYSFGALNCNDSSGQNPWIGGSTGPVEWEGATLVVVYKNSSTSSDRVAVFDHLAGADNVVSGGSFTVSMVTPGTVPPLSGTGLFTQAGADGQTGTSFSSSSTNETDTFNGSLLAGPGGTYPQSNWDGSTGWPMPELYDDHTMDVAFNGTTTNTDTTFVPSDCIAAVVYVLQQGF